MINLTDEELALKYQGGDETAFNELYKRYKNLVKYHCRNFYLVGFDREDVTAEGTLGLIKAVQNYKQGEASFKTFLSMCVKHTLIDAVKKNAKTAETQALDNLDKIGFFALTPEDAFAQKERGAQIRSKIYSVLSRAEQNVLKLYLEGYSYQEIADKLGKNVKSIDNALSRCRAKIIKYLGDFYGISGAV